MKIKLTAEEYWRLTALSQREALEQARAQRAVDAARLKLAECLAKMAEVHGFDASARYQLNEDEMTLEPIVEIAKAPTPRRRETA